MANIEQLRPQDLNCNIFSCYDYDGCSLQEILCQFFHKINECIEVADRTVDLAEWLVNEGLAEEVAKTLVKWKDDGTLAEIINVTIFEKLNTKIKNIVTLEELGAKGDGVTDDIEAFNKAKDLLLKGVVKKIIGNGTYAVSKMIQLAPKNDIEYDLGTIIPHRTFVGDFLINVGDGAGSQANVNFKAVLIDGQNKASGMKITSCGSSTFYVGTYVNCKTAIECSNPPHISSDNMFTGNNIRQCGFGIVLRSEQKSALEGTMIDYRFIYDNKYAGILLGPGSHYADIRTMTDFNGKYSVLFDLAAKPSGLARGNKIQNAGEELEIVEVFDNQVYAISKSKVLADNNTTFQPGVMIGGQRITKTTTNDTDLHIQFYLDIINANTLAGFSKNTIIATYCGGIAGNKMSIATDFILNSRTGQNERNNLNGLSTWINPVEVGVYDFLNNKKIFGYGHNDNTLDLAGNGLMTNKQGFDVVGQFDHKTIASLNNLKTGNYLVNITSLEKQSRASLNDQFSWYGFVSWNREKRASVVKGIFEHNMLIDVNGSDFRLSIKGSIPQAEVYTSFLKIG